MIVASYLFLRARNFSAHTIKAAKGYLTPFVAYNDPLTATKRDIEQHLIELSARCKPSTVWTAWRQTSAKDVQGHSIVLLNLVETIGPPLDPLYSDTYLYLARKANGALDYVKKYPTDKRFGLSFSLDEEVCSKFGFNASNSQYGIDSFTVYRQP
jgi:hypothetical protein